MLTPQYAAPYTGNAEILAQLFATCIRPKDPLTVSQWADANRVLSTRSSAIAGRYRTSLFPFNREIMDCLSRDSRVQMIVYLKSGQVGATEVGNNWLGYVIDYTPCPYMYVGPDQDTLRNSIKAKIDSMIESTPVLAEKVPSKGSKEGGNSMEEKLFPGGIAKLTHAGSMSAIQNFSVRFMHLDEVDRYPKDIKNQGSPIPLLIHRADSFSSTKKIFISSTPDNESTSEIAPRYKASDQRVYRVGCPFCKAFITFEFERLEKVALAGGDTDVQHRCPECDVLMPHHMKTDAMQEKNGAHWHKLNPVSEIAGFYINALYNPNLHWREIMKEHDDAIGDTLKMKAFFNLTLGRVWKDKGDVPEWKRLYDIRERYNPDTLPDADICLITAGCDVQKDRLEVEVVGWMKDRGSYSLGYHTFYGDTLKEEVWENLLALMTEKTWIHAETGLEMAVALMAIDQNFRTETVKDFIRKYKSTRFFIPVRGNHGHDEARILTAKKIETTYQGKIKKTGLTSWYVNVSTLKKTLYEYLNMEKPLDGQPYPRGYCHFPQYDDLYFKGLVSESYVERYFKSRVVTDWEKTFERNEPLDCRIYATACTYRLNLDGLPEDALREKCSPAGRRVLPVTPAEKPRITPKAPEPEKPARVRRERPVRERRERPPRVRRERM